MFDNSLISIKTAKKLIRIYARKDNWHELDYKSGNLGYGWIHYGLIRALKPDRVLVIGSRYGFIPAICALACKDNRKGMVEFVDVGYDQAADDKSKGLVRLLIGLFRLIKLNLGIKERVNRTMELLFQRSIDKNCQQNKNHWGGMGFWEKVNVKKYFNQLGLSDYINFYLMTSLKYQRKYPKRKYQYVYIDGDHSHRGVKSDFKRFWPKLDQNGYLCLHDIYADKVEGLNYGVKNFWEEIQQSKGYNVMEISGEFGLGVIHKEKA
jgi:methyltransferase family protein